MSAPIPPPAQGPRFLVVVDAAHGGSDTGARIGDGVLEADGTPIYWTQDLRVGLYQRP